jgi:putative ABC transport system permease protein
LASGLQRSATNQLYGINDLSLIEVYPGYNVGPSQKIAMSGGGGGGGNSSGEAKPKLLTPDAIKAIAALPNVAQVVIEDNLQVGSNLQFGKLMGGANIIGVDSKDLSIFGYKTSSGSADLVKGTAVVGAWVSRNFYDSSARPGKEAQSPPDLQDQQVKLVLSKYSQDGTEIRKNINLRITGVLTENRDVSDSSIYVPLEDVTAWNEWALGKRINRNQQGYSVLVVKAANVDKVLDLAKAINDMGYMANTPQQVVQSINGFFMVLQVVFGGIGAISLLVAAIGIANTMTMAILERTREIGLMKAIGASNRDVLSIFLGEAAGIGLIGGLGGVTLGWAGSQVINVLGSAYLSGQSSFSGLSSMLAVYTPPWLPAFALLFSTLVGLLSGLYPALRAAALAPVMALKYE